MQINAQSDELANELNAAAVRIYANRMEILDHDVEENDYCAEAVAACSDAAAALNLEIVAQSASDSSIAQALSNEAGTLVNLWLATPEQSASETDFAGIGFDQQLEWYHERVSAGV